MLIENQVTINASTQKVWEVFTDDSKLDQWITGFKSSKTISGQPLEVGSKHEMTFLERGKEMKFLETVTQVKPEHEYSFNISNGTMTSKNSVFLESKGAQTVLRQTVDFQAHSFGFRLMMIFMKGMMKKRNQTDLEKLKRLVESSQV